MINCLVCSCNNQNLSSRTIRRTYRTTIHGQNPAQPELSWSCFEVAIIFSMSINVSAPRLPLLAQCLLHELPAVHWDLPHCHRPQRLQEPALPSHHLPLLHLRLCRHHRHHHHGHRWPPFCRGDSKAERAKGILSNVGGPRYVRPFFLWGLFFTSIFTYSFGSFSLCEGFLFARCSLWGFFVIFLASQDSLEVMRVSEWVSHSLSHWV